jgi:2-keto-4-pentenoate hydratase/2-oxohepta-3-ene-1,7-dioic acid hydratase in catechol pathway
MTYPIVRFSCGVYADLGAGKHLFLHHLVGIGRNYADHAKEQAAAIPDRPMVFTKNPMSACLSGDAIRVPKVCQDRGQVDFEGELAVIIGTDAKDVPLDHAMDHVLGYCCANDVSARWWQKEGSGGQFYRGKSFDTFCPLGPAIIPASHIPDPMNLKLTTRVNGQIMQQDTTAKMIFNVATLISDLSRGMTLSAGTVLLTGTPAGVGMARTPQVWLQHGDQVQVEIEGIGTLSNSVIFE